MSYYISRFTYITFLNLRIARTFGKSFKKPKINANIFSRPTSFLQKKQWKGLTARRIF